MEVDITTAVSFRKIAEVCKSLRFVVLVSARKLIKQLLGPKFNGEIPINVSAEPRDHVQIL
jgi:hypothetical protein